MTLNQLSGTTIAGYGYDGNSMRVVKVWGASRTFDIYAGSQLISEFEDAPSNTYTSGTTPQGAPADTAALVLNQYSDHLNTRYTTDQTGNYANAQGHYPYGEVWYGTGQANASVTRKFTTYIQDGEAANAGMNYAIAREDSVRLGRFYATDPVRNHRCSSSPQALNRYSYTLANPINRRDRTGRDVCDLDDEENFNCEDCAEQRMLASFSNCLANNFLMQGRCNSESAGDALIACAQDSIMSGEGGLGFAVCVVKKGLSEGEYCLLVAGTCALQGYYVYANVITLCNEGYNPAYPWPQEELPIIGPIGGGPGGGPGSGGGGGGCDPLSAGWLDCETGVPKGVRIPVY